MRDREKSCQGRILVVNPEEWCRLFLSSVIKLCGIEEFKLVNTLAEALAVLEECSYDLVITDGQLPGYQRLLENARARHPYIRFITIVQQRTQQIFYMEQVDIVFKPLSLDETIRKIRHALHQKHLRQAEEELRRLKQEALRLFLS